MIALRKNNYLTEIFLIESSPTNLGFKVSVIIRFGAYAMKMGMGQNGNCATSSSKVPPGIN